MLLHIQIVRSSCRWVRLSYLCFSATVAGIYINLLYYITSMQLLLLDNKIQIIVVVNNILTENCYGGSGLPFLTGRNLRQINSACMRQSFMYNIQFGSYRCAILLYELYTLWLSVNICSQTGSIILIYIQYIIFQSRQILLIIYSMLKVNIIIQLQIVASYYGLMPYRQILFLTFYRLSCNFFIRL